MSVQDYTYTANQNTSISGISIGENCPAANINNAIRQELSDTLQELAYQGADMSASASISLASVGWRFMAITGSASIVNLGTGRAGLHRELKWNSPSTLVGSATLITDGGGNIVTATNDVTICVSYGSGTWRAMNIPASGLPPVLQSAVTASATVGTTAFAKNSGGTYSLVQVGPQQTAQIVKTETGAVATGSTLVPFDDSIPQITEGNEYMTLAITPLSSSNRLKIDVVWIGANSAGSGVMAAALFQDSTTDALAAAVRVTTAAANDLMVINFSHYMTAGTTSSTTFRVRVGCSAAGTTTFNGSGGARKYGGVLASSITITELQP